MDSKEVFPPGWETRVKKVLCSIERRCEPEHFWGRHVWEEILKRLV